MGGGEDIDLSPGFTLVIFDGRALLQADARAAGQVGPLRGVRTPAAPRRESCLRSLRQAAQRQGHGAAARSGRAGRRDKAEAGPGAAVMREFLLWTITICGGILCWAAGYAAGVVMTRHNDYRDRLLGGSGAVGSAEWPKLRRL